MSKASSMIDKVEKILEKKEISYMETQGNMHIFQAKAHAPGYDYYMITAQIKLGGSTTNPTDTIEWLCDEGSVQEPEKGCHAFKYSRDRPRTCKHVESAKRLMKTMGLRTEYNERLDEQ